MEIMIPVLVVGAVFFQAYLYARAVYLRRMVMLDRVMKFLEREDATKHLKSFAVHAFHDSTSFRLPLGLVQFRKKREENDPEVRKAEKKFNEASRKDTSSAQARQELDSLIEMMFTINLSFNKIVFFLACLTMMKVKVERKEVAHDFFVDSMQHLNIR